MWCSSADDGVEIIVVSVGLTTTTRYVLIIMALPTSIMIASFETFMLGWVISTH